MPSATAHAIYCIPTNWLSQAQMAQLFQTTKQNVSLHINNIFKAGELNKDSTVKEFLTVQNEGNLREKYLIYATI